mmetsp:Transcript_25602/g.77739  ORF Transcript_25602/g.77739 Transcript_25602/m.77739 type:complete len:213 (-) Transcript_25602:473-1111(-)
MHARMSMRSRLRWYSSGSTSRSRSGRACLRICHNLFDRQLVHTTPPCLRSSGQVAQARHSHYTKRWRLTVLRPIPTRSTLSFRPVNVRVTLPPLWLCLGVLKLWDCGRLPSCTSARCVLLQPQQMAREPRPSCPVCAPEESPAQLQPTPQLSLHAIPLDNGAMALITRPHQVTRGIGSQEAHEAAVPVKATWLTVMVTADLVTTIAASQQHS